MLARVLRAAVVMRLLGVDRGAPPRFRNNALSSTLLDSNPYNVWPMVRSPLPPVCTASSSLVLMVKCCVSKSSLAITALVALRS